MRPRNRAALGAWGAAVLAACAASEVFLAAPWPDRELALWLLLDEESRPLGALRRFEPGSAPHRIALEPGQRARARVYTFDADLQGPDGSPAAGCGVVLGGEGARLPEPRSRWLSDWLGATDRDAPRLHPHEGEPRLDLRWVGCAQVDRGCEGYRTEVVSLPPGLKLERLVALDDQRALLSGASGEGEGSMVPLLFVEGGATRLLPFEPGLRGYAAELIQDHRGSVFGLLRSRDVIFRLDAEGRLLAPSWGDLRDVKELAGGRDGTLLARSTHGAFEISATTTTARPRYDLPEGLRELRIWDRNRMVARDRTTVWVYDGHLWQPDHYIDILEGVSALAVDPEVMVFVGEFELVRVRQPDRSWVRYARPYDVGARLRTVAGLGRGRFLVAGERGALAVWSGSRWCDLRRDEVRTHLHASDVAAGDQAVWVLGRGDDGLPPALIRVEVPPVD